MIADPYLALIEQENPELFKEIYLLLYKNFGDKGPWEYANTPNWILERLYRKGLTGGTWAPSSYIPISTALSHANLDIEIIQEILSEDKKDFFGALVNNPNLTDDQLRYIQTHGTGSAARTARNVLRSREPEAETILLADFSNKNSYGEFVQIMLESETLSASCIDQILTNFTHLSFSKNPELLVGDKLAQNPSLSPETMAALYLLGFSRAHQSNIDFGYLPSSRLMSLHGNGTIVPDPVMSALYSVGHPFSLLEVSIASSNVEVNEINLFQLMKSELLHRAFWRELIDVDGFQFDYRNGYRTNDFFISHQTIGSKFLASGYEEGYKVGGVLDGLDNRDWIERSYTFFDGERAARVIAHHYEEFSEWASEFDEIDELYPIALACILDPDDEFEFGESFGVTLNSEAHKIVKDFALDWAEDEDKEVEVKLNMEFEERFSWAKLDSERKLKLFEILAAGLSFSNTDLREDSEHFLACMALHPATPQNLLVKLSDLQNKMVSDTLARR
jgi:hypothetical protein